MAGEVPEWIERSDFMIVGERVPGKELGYGSNPHQRAALFVDPNSIDPLAINNYDLKMGKDPSYSNILDLHSLAQTLVLAAAGMSVNQGYTSPIAVGNKHTNPCSAGYAVTAEHATQLMIESSVQDIRGGALAFNFGVTEGVANAISYHRMNRGKRRVDLVIAPSITEEAMEILDRKTDMCRVMINPALKAVDERSLDTAPSFKSIRGGIVVEESFRYIPNPRDPNQEFWLWDKPVPENFTLDPRLVFAASVGANTASNTITFVDGDEESGKVIGNAAGQPARHEGVLLARRRAETNGHDTNRTVGYSDSYSPETDAVQFMIDAGLAAVFSMRGAEKDQQIFDLARVNGLPYYTVPVKTGRGFRH